MTLRARLLLTTLALSLVVTLLLALIVGRAWQRAESERFASEFNQAVRELQQELSEQATELDRRLRPLCEHDPQVDSALVGYEAGDLPSRLLPIKLGLRETKQALGLSELALVLDTGEVVAGTWATSAVGPEALAQLPARIQRFESAPALRPEPPLAFEAACKRGGRRTWVALVASVDVEPLLRAAGARHELSLSLVDGADSEPLAETPHRLVTTVQLTDLAGKKLRASRSRVPLSQALRGVYLEIATAALMTLALSLVLGLFVSRGLSRPIVAFAQRTRAALQGSVEPLPVEGGPELEDAARAFNHTLEDLGRLQERLHVTERIAARREVARRVAHEIKNPLSPIRTSIETLRRLRASGSEQFDEFFDEATSTVLDEVRRIANLVQSFSEYARLPSPTPAAFDLQALCRELVTLHADLGPSVRLAEQDAGSLEVLADRDQLKQVMTNLLKNAIEATAGRKEGQVTVRAGRDEDLAWVEVSDNGAGVSPDMVARLFEPYATNKAGGTGLGLPISHRIAVEHGGDLTYASAEGGGACFRLMIPADGPPAALA